MTDTAAILPPAVDLKLKLFCSAIGEEPADVVADAVLLFIDECVPRPTIEEMEGELDAR